MPVWTCRKCRWLLLTVLCVSVCLILRVWGDEANDVGFQGGGAYFYATCQRRSCFCRFPSSLVFVFAHLIVTFSPGVIQLIMATEAGPKIDVGGGWETVIWNCGLILYVEVHEWIMCAIFEWSVVWSVSPRAVHVFAWRRPFGVETLQSIMMKRSKIAQIIRSRISKHNIPARSSARETGCSNYKKLENE